MKHDKLNLYRFVVSFRQGNDPRSNAYLQDGRALGLSFFSDIHCQDIFFIEGNLSEEELDRLANEVFSDPILQTVRWDQLFKQPDEMFENSPPERVVEVALRPGVTDPVAEQIVRVSEMLGIEGVSQASTGLRFMITGTDLRDEQLHELAARLLANPTIQRHEIGEIEPAFPEKASSSGSFESIDIAKMSDEELLTLSHDRRASLDLNEMQKIRSYYQAEQRMMTDVEFEMIAQTWSEHCVHKTFKAEITLDSGDAQPEKINGILKTFLRSATEEINAPWVRSAFVDNAGIIDFDEENEISFKVETHNHPSAIEPFGGANTGIGGVIRDVLGVSAKPIAATDVLCFGHKDISLDELPAGVLHPRRIYSGVVGGIEDYGNKIGIPTVNGAVLYDHGFTANPLVYCGCVGIAPKDSHRFTPEPGDHVIVIGGKTGRDGLRGATFSSMTMDAQTGEVSGASVQIGDPITEKGLIEVTTRARDAELYTAITDCGAGGLSSAVGEMSSKIGADVELQAVKLKYPGLAPWEIWLSEAQERMVLAVPEENLAALEKLCWTYDVDMTNMGTFNNSGELIVRFAEKEVLRLSNEFLHEGIPQRKLKAVKPQIETRADADFQAPQNKERYGELLLKLLAHPNIASKEEIIHCYDHEVQGGTAVKPLVGLEKDGPSDAAIIKPIGTKMQRGIVLSNGINPEYGKHDPYRMALSVMDEALRNAVAVGADPSHVAVLDNFCWGDPTNPHTLGTLVEASRGCYDAALMFKTPFISGKDSLNNEYLGNDGKRHAIPPSLLISAIGLIDDAADAVTMDLKTPGNLLYLLGEHQKCFGGSHLNLITDEYKDLLNSKVPDVPEFVPRLYQQLNQAIKDKLICACHDLSEGGLAVAAAEMALAGRLGLELTLNDENPFMQLFGETNSCLLVEVHPTRQAEFKSCFADLPFERLGTVQQEQVLSISVDDSKLVELPVEEILNSWLTRA